MCNFVPIYSNCDEIFMTINPSYLTEFLDKYIINDCPDEASIKIFGTNFQDEHSEAAFIMDDNYFRLNNEVCNFMDSYKLIYGFSEIDSKEKERLEDLLKKKDFMSVNYMLRDKKINESDMHALILNKFKTISTIELSNHFLGNSIFITISDKDPVIDKNCDTTVGYLSLKKLSGEKYCPSVIDNLYEFLRVIDN